ncbi:YwiC-like family protein [Arcanobacterium pinnipediorum]|uniref:YwiC-like family protein n=1 Tax=Arcanobacterium pinnipediorum TaxID=1503041 RepID=A0ABY5AIF9_9ACTO|nr:YwiC-like family protein [Arcanobacterium pinnipediorum]
MVIIPPLLGIALSGWSWLHLVLIPLWWIGYFEFFAIGLWLRSRAKARYRTPVIVYSLPCIILGLILAWYAPALLIWIPVFLPLIAITFWQSWLRKDRSLLNDTVTVSAASLMLMVSAHLGSLSAQSFSWADAWITTGYVFGYFMGTVFYIKTNIRQRGNMSWLITSVLWHGGWLIVAGLDSSGFLTVPSTHVSYWHTGVWAILLARAIAVPTWGARRGWLSAKILGIAEIVFSAGVTATLLLSH